MDTIDYMLTIKNKILDSKKRDKVEFDKIHLELIRLDHELEEIKDLLRLEDSTLDFTSIDTE